MILVFAALSSVFLAAVAAFWVSARHLRDHAWSISSQAAPAVVRLRRAHTQVSRIELALRSADSAQRIRELRASAHELRRELVAYRELSPLLGQQAAPAELEIRAAAIERAIAETTEAAAHAPTEVADAEAGLRHALEGFNRSVEGAIDRSAGAGAALALEIDRHWARLEKRAAVLGGLALCALALAASLVVRAVGRSRREADRRAEELEQFAARVAHDVASPLGAVRLALGVLRRSGAGEREQRAVLRAEASLTRACQVVEALHGFARSGARPDPSARAPVREAVEGVLAQHQAEAALLGVGLQAGAIDPCVARCSPGVLVVLVQNLLSNAIKYLGDRQVRRVGVRVLRRGGHVRVEVEDTGPGLTPQLQQAVFEPYFRGPGKDKRPGLGLGLATVRRIAEAHGGSCGVLSSPGAGSTFWFELPRHLRTREDSGAPPLHAAA
ncbi:MAG: HAMP domain-containing histidine kinase [Myxococcales bacterium]|nr:HAMP domain-containing histidine kinase [Myxococcales bacterium]